jgi:hypothetical protein
MCDRKSLEPAEILTSSQSNQAFAGGKINAWIGTDILKIFASFALNKMRKFGRLAFPCRGKLHAKSAKIFKREA